MINPVSSYRLQLNPDFGFREAGNIVDYLSALGISHIYFSPIFTAVPGSCHGYDIVDPLTISDELGGSEEYDRLSLKIHNKGLYCMQDIVPNHMGYHSANNMLMDIFEKREKSEFFGFFDIDWVHPFTHFQGRVLAPFLGSFYSECLMRREIKFAFNQKGLSVSYYDYSFPLFIKTYKLVLLRDIDKLEDTLGKEDPLIIKYHGIVNLFDSIYSGHNDKRELDPQLKHAKKLLWQVYSGNERIKQHIDGILRYLNGETVDEDFCYAADEILSKQCYRFAFWKVASEELNYRRFFTINELISLRVEKEHVMMRTHSLILDLVKRGSIDSLRIDHIDGLYDPCGYLELLRQRIGEDIHVITEKILHGSEPLPSVWPVQGTTGYDFLSMVNGLFCDSRAEKHFTDIYSKFIGTTLNFESVVRQKKRLIIGKHMAGDIDNLAYLMKKVSARNMYGRDITLYGLKRALVEVMSCFPVYRTYLGRERQGNGEETEYIDQAIERSRVTARGFDYELDFIRKFLTLDFIDDLEEDEKEDFWHFIMRFQQLTAPIMAKGFEDTVFYNYNRFISLNEVGNDPGVFGISAKRFHGFNSERYKKSPGTMNATSTHDTKRGEDVRARLNVLSELPEEWETHLYLWSETNRQHKNHSGGGSCPDANDEYFLYQTMLGAYPFSGAKDPGFKERLKQYMVKAVREAKVHTAWVKPDEEYENMCLQFIDRIWEQESFWKDFMPFYRKISYYGILNSLSQVLCKISAPGFPDIYQGTELWDLNLVDPDNRRSVDYSIREQYLNKCLVTEEKDIPEFAAGLMRGYYTGAIKQFIIWRSLSIRNKYAALFQEGEYLPLMTSGERAGNIMAFARKHGKLMSITVIPRFLTGVVEENILPTGVEAWADTQLILPFDETTEFTDVLTGRKITVSGKVKVCDILDTLPISLLICEK